MVRTLSRDGELNAAPVRGRATGTDKTGGPGGAGWVRRGLAKRMGEQAMAAGAQLVGRATFDGRRRVELKATDGTNNNRWWGSLVVDDGRERNTTV